MKIIKWIGKNYTWYSLNTEYNGKFVSFDIVEAEALMRVEMNGIPYCEIDLR